MFNHVFLGCHESEFYIMNSQGVTLVQGSRLEDLAVALVQHHSTHGDGTLGIYYGFVPETAALPVLPCTPDDIELFSHHVEKIYGF